MRNLELNEMGQLQGGYDRGNVIACGLAVGVGLAAITVMGPWGLVIGMSLFCGNEAY